jgi:hypothetical protein
VTYEKGHAEVVAAGITVRVASAVRPPIGVAGRFTLKLAGGDLQVSATAPGHVDRRIAGIVRSLVGDRLVLELETGAIVALEAAPGVRGGTAVGSRIVAAIGRVGARWTASSLRRDTQRPPARPGKRFLVAGTVAALNAPIVVITAGTATGSYAIPADADVEAVVAGDRALVAGRLTAGFPEIDQLVYLDHPLPPPTLTLTQSPPASSAVTDATVSWDATGAGASTTCALDAGTATPCDATWTGASLAAGPHALVVVATSATGTARLTVDWFVVPTSAPTLAFTTTPASATTSTSAAFAWTLGGYAATVTCSLDGALPAVACAGSTSVSGLVPGDHALAVTATNQAGAATITSTWTVGAPTVAFSSAPPPSTSSTSATFDWQITGHATLYTCTLDADAPTPCTPPYGANALAVGGHDLSVVGTNAAGTGTPTTVHWTVTSSGPVAPTVTLAAPVADPNDATAETFSWTTTGSPTVEQCTYDGLDYEACPNPIHITGFAVGTHTFDVQVSGAGGSSSPASVTWKRTTPGSAAPALTMTQSQPSGLGFTNANFAWTTTGDVTDVTCVLDARPAAPCSSVARYAGLPLGTHTFQVTATGGHGSSSTTPYSWTIVTPTAPSIGSFSGPPAQTVAQNATFTWQIQTLPPYTLTCTVDGAPVTCSSGVPLGPFAPGAHAFLLAAANSAGSTSRSASWTVTTAPPGGPAPASTTPPAIAGTPRTHAILSASSGGWSGSPFLFSYIWRRCDTSGAACADIAGATAATYSPTPFDVGHRLRVAVIATNGGGASTEAVSAATATQTS